MTPTVPRTSVAGTPAAPNRSAARSEREAAVELEIDLDVLIETKLPEELAGADWADLVRDVLAREGARGAWSVALVLTDDERLRVLHRDFMGIDAETDVMTFPRADDANVPGEAQGGDIVVSVERAADQAAVFGLTPADEIRFLVVHGLLHLRGWRDTDPDRRQAMLARQAELLRAHDRERGDAASAAGGS